MYLIVETQNGLQLQNKNLNNAFKIFETYNHNPYPLTITS